MSNGMCTSATFLNVSPGAKPAQPRLPGVGIDKLFTLRTVEDTFRIKEYITKHQPKSAILAGGGFIGLELAENLRELGMDVTIVQRPKQLMRPFDADMAAFIHSEMRKNGVKLALGYTVEGFVEKDGGVAKLYRLPGALGNIGLISPISAHFCGECNRLRLTADGKLKPCLHAPDEYSIKGLDRAGTKAVFEQAIWNKPAWHGDLDALHPSQAGRNMNEIGG